MWKEKIEEKIEKENEVNIWKSITKEFSKR